MKEDVSLKTTLFTEFSDENIARGAQILKNGGLLGIPTETVYGLGANALDADACRRIYEAKGRPQDNPLIIHVPDSSWLPRYCREVPESAYRLAVAFWPGPLTMILPKREIVPARTTGGLDTVGVRCPNHPVTLALIRAADVPVAAPSGNPSGRPSPTTAADMMEDMDGKIDGVFDGGPCRVGVESTIIDLTCTPPRLLRAGGLPLEALQSVLGEVIVDRCITQLMTGDGVKSAGYIRAHAPAGAGVICFSEFAALFPEQVVHDLGPEGDKSEQARRVFDALRAFDATAVPEIYAQCPDDAGLGLAIGNRLKKAAGFHVVEAGEC